MEEIQEPIHDKNNDNILISGLYRELLHTCRKANVRDDEGLIRKAYELAVDAHKDMRRKSGEPYVIHPIEVAKIVVTEIGLGTTSVVSALLHDVVEDCDIPIETIKEIFGEKVSRIVEGLTNG